MRIDKPVYCFQINREIFKFLGLPIKAEFHSTFLRANVLSTTRPLYAGHAQVVECFHDAPLLIQEIRELVEHQLFVALSRHRILSDFLDARRRMYEWDKLSYPMYFENNLPDFRGFPTTDVGDPSTTSILRKTFSTLYKDEAPKFENRLSLEEKRILLKAATRIRKFVSSEDGALTPAFFRRIPSIGVAADSLLSKLLPSQFTDIYIDVFEGFTPTGFPGLSQFEDTRSFPFLDFNALLSLLEKLNLRRLLFDNTSDGFRRFLTFRLNNNFSEFVRAKDRLLSILKYSINERTPHSAGIIADLRELRIRALDENAEPVSAAAEIYRASEELGKKVAGGLTMPDALSWQGQYLLVTATDLEDRVLQSAMDARGFSPPEVVNEERFSYLVRFRSDVGRVFHVRTSAGSGGASGAFIMGKNAIDCLKPKFVIAVGICFGLKEKKQHLCDVVVSELIYDYESQRVSKQKPENRGAKREGSPQLLSRARANLIIWKKANVHVGTVLSGEKLVDDSEFRETLLKIHPSAVAGEMEAWGLSAVCHESQRQFLMVKGICDWGMNKDKDYQEQAARNACDFVLESLVVG
ncbi:hypothetical protein ACQR1H_14730 [Bradyrhizobium sp. HKCCYLRH2015]|uniref:5'-methylthioadenosine/S-adenosylhomocysteine nucleosidase family protein n=1 Tax=Bradyrhizobium sp. HKCCYLRH2015 TaxID=3420742 RepID=UPI003EBC9A8E